MTKDEEGKRKIRFSPSCYFEYRFHSDIRAKKSKELINLVVVRVCVLGVVRIGKAGECSRRRRRSNQMRRTRRRSRRRGKRSRDTYEGTRGTTNRGCSRSLHKRIPHRTILRWRSHPIHPNPFVVVVFSKGRKYRTTTLRMLRNRHTKHLFRSGSYKVIFIFQPSPRPHNLLRLKRNFNRTPTLHNLCPSMTRIIPLLLPILLIPIRILLWFAMHFLQTTHKTPTHKKRGGRGTLSKPPSTPRKERKKKNCAETSPHVFFLFRFPNKAILVLNT